MYFLYKAHKTPPSVCPIVSGVKGPMETASWFLNEALKMILPNLPHLLLDPLEAINQLENLHAPKQCLLVTIDVKSLYTNISQREGTERVLKYYYNTPLSSYMPERVAHYLLRAVLSHNHFEFNGEAYRQKSDVVICTKCAPTFANIFLASVEEEFLAMRQSRGAMEPSLWLRFIDDILVVWPGLWEGFSDFLAELNSFHPNLEYTSEESTTNINFLDLRIYKGARFRERGIFDLGPY